MLQERAVLISKLSSLQSAYSGLPNFTMIAQSLTVINQSSNAMVAAALFPNIERTIAALQSDLNGLPNITAVNQTVTQLVTSIQQISVSFLLCLPSVPRTCRVRVCPWFK